MTIGENRNKDRSTVKTENVAVFETSSSVITERWCSRWTAFALPIRVSTSLFRLLGRVMVGAFQWRNEANTAVWRFQLSVQPKISHAKQRAYWWTKRPKSELCDLNGLYIFSGYTNQDSDLHARRKQRNFF